MPTSPDGFPQNIITGSGHNAFPGVERMANGQLILVYRKGTDHADSEDGAIYKKISADNGASWSAEALVYDHAQDVRDPSITLLSDGTLIILFFRYVLSSEAGDVFTIRSTDNGATWDTPVALGSSFTTYEYASAKVVELANGDLIAPLYGGTVAGVYSAITKKSTDGGDTWGSQVTIVSSGGGGIWSEPYIVLLPSGDLHCLMRASDGNVWRSVSDDDGATWTTASFAFSNGNGRPTHIVTPTNLLYAGRPYPGGFTEWAISEDDGVSWSDRETLVGIGANSTYASFVELDETHYLCVYGTEDVTLTQGDLDSTVFTVPGPPPEGDPGFPPTPTPAAKAILEIYVHDEDASRWGVATWATGPATGTEGIWSAAGWQDVTPEGVNAHIIWGSRRPARGILAEQGPASWNVQTYDPDRILDPGNFDSPFYPQLVAGVPIRISHESLVIRTGYVDEFHYKHKRPDYQGQLLCSDTWSLLNQAMVPPDSILGNTLLERIQDAVNAAGIAVGGIPLPPSGPSGPTIADWEEGTPLDDPTSVGDHIRIAASEVLWVPFIQADAGLGLRPWGSPLDRAREITAANLEDLEAVSHEDGLYSVVKVQVEDPDADPIIRKASPLPRYGERVWERREPTVDPEGYAAAILAERPWPGVQYIPGAIHCFTAADVDYFGSLEIMERVTVTVAGAVSVQGRILGGELFVEHRARDTKGAKWIFNFAIATDGATAIGLTTLVADGTGDTLVDDMTGTDYLEAD